MQGRPRGMSGLARTSSMCQLFACRTAATHCIRGAAADNRTRSQLTVNAPEVHIGITGQCTGSDSRCTGSKSKCK